MSEPEHLEIEDTDSELPRNEARIEELLWGTGAGAGAVGRDRCWD